ncbi:MAG: RdgB/HAM1 family non-canonical purine NTP pyrophosphatase [Candidatus Fermentibacteraceae bacterium]|nr:RdgB/HAM1 family non-canonical purine NTP pyrophosphatase [Candidatus Fermentibacteraceae bacterium]
MSCIVFASANKDKLQELRMLADGGDIVAIGDIIPGWDVEETGLTLEENALLKARTAAEATNKVAIADDTGLFVWALGDAPGVYTARYAGENCSYYDNTVKLLNALSGERDSNRRASFRTVIALVSPDGEEHVFEGSVDGLITEVHSGKDGFGYDPVFFSTELNKTFAECTIEEKNRVSHRARAMHKLNEFLRSRP